MKNINEFDIDELNQQDRIELFSQLNLIAIKSNTQYIFGALWTILTFFFLLSLHFFASFASFVLAIAYLIGGDLKNSKARKEILSRYFKIIPRGKANGKGRK